MKKLFLSVCLFLFANFLNAEEFVGQIFAEKIKPYDTYYYLYVPTTKQEYQILPKNVDQDFFLIESTIKDWPVSIKGKIEYKIPLKRPILILEKFDKK